MANLTGVGFAIFATGAANLLIAVQILGIIPAGRWAGLYTVQQLLSAPARMLLIEADIVTLPPNPVGARV